ncbi:hypothetical protein [Pinirhizobacter sp.]|uniref:hypothetical protein n=1 Tax=Pinirhizobacter sp. TaxID=2950432 RepID=UPI002F3EE725
MPNDFIPVSDGSSAHRSIYVPLEIAQLDTRVTRLEVITEGISSRFDEHKIEFRDFRTEVYARFDKIDDRFEKLDAKFEDRFEKLDAKFEDRFEKLDAKFEDRFEKLDAKFEDRFGKFDAKFERVNGRFEQFRVHARSDFHLLFGSLIASVLGLAGMMAKGFGWF